MLTGLIYCKNCGSKYTFVKGSTKSSYAICRNKKIYGKMVCYSKNIKEDILNEKVLNSLKDIFSKYANKDYILNNLNFESNNSIKESLLQEKGNLETKLNENNNIKFNLYKDKTNNVISEKDYIEFSNKLSNDILNLENKINSINNEIEQISTNHKNKENMLQLVDKFLSAENITRNDILQLIDKIEIGAQCEHLKIFFKFSI